MIIHSKNKDNIQHQDLESSLWNGGMLQLETKEKRPRLIWILIYAV
jgi:hypothetical protein